MPHAPVTVVRGRPPMRAVVIMAWTAASLLGETVATGSQPAASRAPAAVSRSRPIVDSAVVPAGGVACRQCGRPGCRLHHGHLAECRDGLCAPHCPVRPGEYGFYHTRWRRWPGQGVVPASAEDAATPARPPEAQVPTVEEESPTLPDEEPLPPDGGLASDPIPEEPAAERVERAEPSKPEREPEPAADEPVPPVPPGDPKGPPATDPADAGLFDQSVSPPPATSEPIDAGAMRYPAQVGRSLAAGAAPWRLEPLARHRADGSARGR